MAVGTSPENSLYMAERTGKNGLLKEMLGHLAVYMELQSAGNGTAFTAADFQKVLAANPELPTPNDVGKTLKKAKEIFSVGEDGAYRLTPEARRNYRAPSLSRTKQIAVSVEAPTQKTPEDLERTLVAHIKNMHIDSYMRDVATFRFHNLLPPFESWHVDDEVMKAEIKTPRGELVEKGLLQTRDIGGQREYALTEKAQGLLAEAIEAEKLLQESSSDVRLQEWIARVHGKGRGDRGISG